MEQKKSEPESGGNRVRLRVFDGFGDALDTQNDNSTDEGNLAIWYLMRRFALTKERARLVAELSGLGGSQ